MKMLKNILNILKLSNTLFCTENADSKTINKICILDGINAGMTVQLL